MRMIFTSKRFFFLLFLIYYAGLPSFLSADGFIIPKPEPGEDIPPLTVKYHRVNVEIRDQVAETSIDQVFINNHHRDIEGIYIFPIPEKAAISRFSMYVGGKRLEGEILDKEKARRIYEDIVRKMKDPALLEYMGRKLFRARIYPIPARGEKRITLSYTEVLQADRNVIRYVYPLNTERFSLHPIEEVTLSVDLRSQVPFSSIYSPSHKVSIKKEDAGKARVSFEEKMSKPEKDFILYYTLTEDEIGLSWLSWTDQESGYFLLLASPVFAPKKEKVLNKDLILVLDSSGSMSGRKMDQAKKAARFIIEHLARKDRFSIIDFDDGVELFSQDLVSPDEKSLKEAIAFIDEVEDSGGTNINESLTHAISMVEPGDRPAYILFLTDGLPTVGVTGTPQILKNLDQANTHKTRIFVFGVGHDVNTELLDRISLDNRGTSVYVGEDEDLEAAMSSYYEKISSPLLSDISLEFSGIRTKDMYPRVLPDLFKGSQLILLGKYTGEGPVTVSLTGKVGEKSRTFRLKNQKLTQDDSLSFLGRLWATRRIGYLLEEIRLHGEKSELVDEVRKLGLKHGVVTPYTSFLVTEKERYEMDAAAPEAIQAFEAKDVTGAGAFRIAKATQQLKDEEQAVQVRSQVIRYKDDKTFYLKEDIWVDSDYKEGSPVKEIEFNSDAYFRLIMKNPGIAKYLSVGKNLIVCYGSKNYKVQAQ